MEITQIETTIAQLTSAAGYTPIITSERKVEKMIKAMPTAWIELPKVLYVDGRNEGVIGHSIIVKLIDNFKGFSTEQQAERLAEMQSDAIEIMTHLSIAEGIVEVTNITVTPQMMPTTNHDNIAQVCKATVVSYF